MKYSIVNDATGRFVPGIIFFLLSVFLFVQQNVDGCLRNSTVLEKLYMAVLLLFHVFVVVHSVVVIGFWMFGC